MSDWVRAPDNPMDYMGFVYMITHMETGCYYIGKKQTRKRVRRKPLKGKKRHRICWLESDWRSYWGSSEKLLEAIEREGKDAFCREVIRLCKSKHELAYEELSMQMANNVLEDPLSFNGILNIRLSKPVGDPIAHARKNRNE
jgi:hypothetical protein